MSRKSGRGVFGPEMLESRALLSSERLLGLDVSAWQGDISQATWNNIRSVEERRFVFARASRGGTSSVRYDDPYFVQNVNRAVSAGIFAGSYHYSRPDVLTNTGADEADHFFQMAGAFMRPGYLPPVLDLESGDGIRTDNEIAQFAVDFSNRIYETMRIRPMIYVNGNYAYYVLSNASSVLRDQIARPPSVLPGLSSPYFPLWMARYPNPTNVGAINVQTGNPSDGLSWVYGPWDDYGNSQPWTFWQYADTGRLKSFNNGASNLDFNVVRGGIEFLKDQLVPAVWWNDLSGDWGVLSNWNSGQSAIVPVRVSGQPAPVGAQTLPSPRLPGSAGASVTSGVNDTVILDRPNANITVTLGSGSYNVRKLYIREAFNLTGGSLTVNYVPVADSSPMTVQVSSPVTVSGGSLSAHTILVDAGRTFSLGNASLNFSSLVLSRGSSPATLLINGDVSFSGSGSVSTNSGTLSSGRVDLAGGNRTFDVSAGEVVVSVPVVNGGIVKSGAGTLRLASTYSGPIVVRGGTLVLSSPVASSVRVESGVLSVSQPVQSGQTVEGNGTIVGDVVFGRGSTLSPGVSDPIRTSSFGVAGADQISDPIVSTYTAAGPVSSEPVVISHDMWMAYAISQEFESTKKRIVS